MPAKVEEEKGNFNKDKFEWTLAKYAFLILLAGVYFINFSTFGMLSTFFPSEATNIGATKGEIGLIFGAYSVVAFPASFVYGILIPIFGAEKLLFVGILTNGITVFLFAFVNLMPSSGWFVGACLVLRVLAALGGAACETTIRAILITDFGNNVGFTMGAVSTAAQLAFTVGPVLGGVLYSVGGFKLPFLVFGSVLMLLLLLLFSFLPRKDRDSTSIPMKTFTKTLTIPGVALMALATTISVSNVTVLDPTLAPHIYSFEPHASAATVGLIFLISAAFSGSLSPLIGWICDKTGASDIALTSGLVVGGISLLLIGPAPFLTSFLPTKKIWLVCVAMTINGVSGALAFSPSVSLMTVYASDAGMPDDLATSGAISGISTAAANLGSLTGPVIGGFIIQWLGFPWCVAIFGFLSVFQAVVTGVLTYFFRAFKLNGGPIYSKVMTDE